MPLQMLALGWAVSLGLGIEDSASNLQSLISNLILWFVGGLAIGVLRATNTWDWPTYLVIGGLAVVFHAYQRDKQFNLSTLFRAGLQVGLLFGVAIITFWPFAANYGVGYTSASLWPGSYTRLGNYLVIYGLFLFFIFTHLAREFRAWTRTWTQEGLQQFESFALPLILALLLYIIILLLLVLKGYLIAPLVMSLILVAGLLSLRRDIDPARRIILILIACALGLTLIVEFVVLDGDIGRMNTVFKFYMQVWLILSIVGGVTAVWAIPSLKTRPITRRIWRVALSLLIATAALYPILATRAKWQIRMSKEAPNTLNGSAFIPFVEYGDTDYAGQSKTIRLADDFNALQWIQRNIEGSPVIAEAHSGNPYRSIGNRVAMYTGLPAIVGWDWHQRQQRAVVPGSMVTDRIEDVKTLYNTPEIEQAISILDKYNVGYIYLGELERTYYFPQGVEKFDQMVNEGILEVVYGDTAVTIFRVSTVQ